MRFLGLLEALVVPVIIFGSAGVIALSYQGSKISRLNELTRSIDETSDFYSDEPKPKSPKLKTITPRSISPVSVKPQKVSPLKLEVSVGSETKSISIIPTSESFLSFDKWTMQGDIQINTQNDESYLVKRWLKHPSEGGLPECRYSFEKIPKTSTNKGSKLMEMIKMFSQEHEQNCDSDKSKNWFSRN